MASQHLTRSLSVAPDFTKHKVVDAAAESGPYVTKEHGINCQNHENVIVDVKAEGGANPNIAVRFWSEESEAFVSENPALTKTGLGADTGYQFAVAALGRTMFIEVTGGLTDPAHIATISVAGYGLDHTL